MSWRYLFLALRDIPPEGRPVVAHTDEAGRTDFLFPTPGPGTETPMVPPDCAVDPADGCYMFAPGTSEAAECRRACRMRG